jgi:hypothetical protein
MSQELIETLAGGGHFPGCPQQNRLMISLAGDSIISRLKSRGQLESNLWDS